MTLSCVQGDKLPNLLAEWMLGIVTNNSNRVEDKVMIELRQRKTC